VVKEALACNIPFVSTDVSDLARIAAVEAGCVVAPADPDALADGILKAIETKPSGTLRRHVERMALPTIAEELHTIYDAVLSRKLKVAA
jgi:glycosyltransferase involved in cell wall biosynthesis